MSITRLNAVTRPTTPIEDPRFLVIRRVACSSGIALGVLYAYSFRFLMSPDGIGYLDVASAYLRHDWQTAINGWWSPSFCWLLALFINFLHPTARTEYPLVHLVTFLSFAFASWAFYILWETIRISTQETATELVGLPTLTPIAIDLFVYALFFSLFLPLIALPTPDVLSSGLLFLVAHRLLRFEFVKSLNWKDGVFLGVFCGLAYLTKAIFVYFSVVALVIALLRARTVSNKLLLLTAVMVFSAVVAPWVLLLHRSFGVWTLGFSGQTNYKWFVDGTDTDRFLEPNGAPLPYFPGSVVFSPPMIYRVQTQPNITYVPWYDPARFYKSPPIYFRLQGQISAIKKNVVWLQTWLFASLAPLSLPVICLFLGSDVPIRRTIARYCTVLVPALAVFFMYGLIFIRTPRYIAAITVMVFAILLASARFGRYNRGLARSVLGVGLVVLVIMSSPGAEDVIAAAFDPRPNSTVEAAVGLSRAGILVNAHVAIVGSAMYSYWAHLAKVNIAAEIWNDGVPEFWASDPVRRQEMLCAMVNSGAAVVVGSPPENANLENWRRLGKSEYWMLQLSQRDCTAR